MKRPLRILIADDNRMMVKTLQDILRVKGYQSLGVYSGDEAIEQVNSGQFDCLISDIKMPGLNGVELFRLVKAQQPDLPIVLMTAYATDDLVETGLDEGVVAVLTKPLDLDRLLEFLAYLKKERSVIIIDDDPAFCQTLGDILKAHAFEVRTLTEPAGLIEQLAGKREVVLLDLRLRGCSGLDILRRLRQQYGELPVILVTGYPQELSSAIETALKLNAHTCLYKPLPIDELLQALNVLHHWEMGRQLGRPLSKKL